MESRYYNCLSPSPSLDMLVVSNLSVLQTWSYDSFGIYSLLVSLYKTQRNGNVSSSWLALLSGSLEPFISFPCQQPYQEQTSFTTILRALSFAHFSIIIAANGSCYILVARCLFTELWLWSWCRGSSMSCFYSDWLVSKPKEVIASACGLGSGKILIISSFRLKLLLGPHTHSSGWYHSIFNVNSLISIDFVWVLTIIVKDLPFLSFLSILAYIHIYVWLSYVIQLCIIIYYIIHHGYS